MGAVKAAIVNRQSVLLSHYVGSVPSFKAGYDGTNGATGAQLSMELLTRTHNTRLSQSPVVYGSSEIAEERDFTFSVIFSDIFSEKKKQMENKTELLESHLQREP